MTIYVGYDKHGDEVIRSSFKHLVQAHIAAVLIEQFKEDS